jgi:cytochrome c556
MKKIALVTTAVAIALFAGSSFADKERDPKKQAVKARKAAFTLMAANVGPMGAMVKEKKPFDQEEFSKRAGNLEMLADMPWEYFIPGSNKGKSESKKKVWENPEDFKKKADEFKQEVAKLVEVSKGGDQKAMFEQFGATAKSCKSCHKEYKKKD